MSNRFGQAYGLTIFSPIINGNEDSGESHDIALRRDLRAVNNAPMSPFASVSGTHLARWCMIDEAPYESLPAKVDHFKSKYLLFTSNFDGGKDADDVALAKYIESMRISIGSVLDRLYGHCLAYPGSTDARSFLAYFKSCQVETTFYFGAYPEATLPQILRALDAQRRVGSFIADQQDARPTPAQLQAAYTALTTSLANAPTPVPGTYS